MKKKNYYIPLVLICFLALLLGSILYHRQQFVARKLAFESISPRTSLDAPNKNIEALIPFTYWHHWIYIHATSGGKPVPCVFDTGMSCPIWSSSLPLSARRTGVVYPDYSPYIGTDQRPAELMVLNQLKLGQFEVYGVPGIAYSPKDPASLMSSILFLGNSAFIHMVVTIDYKKLELIVRRSGAEATIVKQYFNVNKQALCRARYFNFVWDTANYPIGPGAPMITGTIHSHPASILFDTGNAAFPLAITNTKLSLLLKQESHGNLYSSSYIRHKETPVIPWSLGNLTFHTPVAFIPEFAGSISDATLGEPIIKNFRVTIDYSQKQIFLQ